MSTNSTITALCKDGQYRSITCHYDGYPSHQSPLLYNHYNHPDPIEKLIALGNISVLAESPEWDPRHTFATPVKGLVIAYMRDRGETGQRASKGSTAEMARYNGSGDLAYNYVWDGELWTVNGCPITELEWFHTQTTNG